jgi:hypothetical protein
MRSLLMMILIIYLFGVVLVLWPTIQSKWSVAPASDLSASIDQELPYALGWPVRLVHDLEAFGRRDNASLRGSIPPEG